ncbi:hypothetical protein WJ972_18910 [Achromobacter insuavis]
MLRYPVREPLGYPALEQRVRQALPSQAPFVLLAESFSPWAPPSPPRRRRTCAA